MRRLQGGACRRYSVRKLAEGRCNAPRPLIPVAHGLLGESSPTPRFPYTDRGVFVSIPLMVQVWEDAPLKGGDLMVLLILANYADEDGTCFPSIDTLARLSRLSVRGVQESLKAARECGWLEVDVNASRYRTNVYRVTPQILRGAESRRQTAPDPKGSGSLDPDPSDSGKRPDPDRIPRKERPLNHGVYAPFIRRS